LDPACLLQIFTMIVAVAGRFNRYLWRKMAVNFIGTYVDDPGLLNMAGQVGKDGELRRIHLLEHPIVNEFITSYPQPGENRITRKLTKSSIGWELTDEANSVGRIWIYNDQYFDGYRRWPGRCTSAA